MKPLLRSLAAATLLAASLAQAQTTTTLPASIQVSQLAPQLISFAGGQTNFDNLANGLAAGVPVTLVTQLLSGQVQTVTFTPQGTMTPTQIAQTLVAAQQSLIGQGIGVPTSQQVAIALTGGVLPTQVGAVQVAGVLPAANRPATAGAGGTVPPPTTAPSIVPQRSAPTATAPVATSANTPVTVTTTPAAPVTNPNGVPGPAAQIQGQTEAGGLTPPGPAAILQNQRSGNVSDTPTVGNISNNPATGNTQLGNTSPTTPVAPSTAPAASGSTAPATAAPSSGRGLR